MEDLEDKVAQWRTLDTYDLDSFEFYKTRLQYLLTNMFRIR